MKQQNVLISSINKIIFRLIMILVLVVGSIFTCLAQSQALPLYRLRVSEPENPGSNDPKELFKPLVQTRHFYTTSQAERDKYLKNGSINEGIEGYIYKPADGKCPDGMLPLRHLVRTADGKHFYTQSSDEANQAAGSMGYVTKEMLGCVWTKKINKTLPLYRLYYYAKVRDDHFYTVSRKDRDDAQNTYKYKYEGIVGYVFEKPVKVQSNGQIYVETTFPDAVDYSVQTKNSRKHFVLAAELLLGLKNINDYQIHNWIWKMVSPPYSFVLEEDTASLPQVNQFFRKLLASPEGKNLRETLVDNAAQDVFNRPRDPAELAKYEPLIISGKAAFISIRGDMTQKLLADPKSHRQLIEKAYLSAFGTIPYPAQLEKWVKWQKGYGETIELMRQHLYSSANIQELTDMLFRASIKIYGKPPTADVVTKSIEAFRPSRKIYSEINQLPIN